MKTIALSIIAALIMSLNVNAKASDPNSSPNDNQKIRNEISQRLGVPEIHKDKVDNSIVWVQFRIENGTIILQEIFGQNDYLNNYVAEKLHHYKLKKFKPAENSQWYWIPISFNPTSI